MGNLFKRSAKKEKVPEQADEEVYGNLALLRPKEQNHAFKSDAVAVAPNASDMGVFLGIQTAIHAAVRQTANSGVAMEGQFMPNGGFRIARAKICYIDNVELTSKPRYWRKYSIDQWSSRLTFMY